MYYIYIRVCIYNVSYFLQAVSDLLVVCKGAVQSAENEDVKIKTLSSAKQTAESYLSLLKQLSEVSQ